MLPLFGVSLLHAISMLLTVSAFRISNVSCCKVCDGPRFLFIISAALNVISLSLWRWRTAGSRDDTFACSRRTCSFRAKKEVTDTVGRNRSRKCSSSG